MAIMRALLSIIVVVIAGFMGCTSPDKEAMQTVKQNIMDTGFAPVNGLDIYYEIHGEGEPLVLIHGGGSTMHTTFGAILPMLAREFRVIGVDLQAHGRTKDRDTPTTFEQDADDVAALLKYLKIDSAHIFGFSNGGNTAMQLANRHPQLVRKLVIASSFYKKAGLPEGFFESMQDATLESMPKPYHDAYLRLNNDSNGLRKMFERDKSRMAGFVDWNEELLTSIKAPSLILIGDRDIVSREHAVEMSRKIPDCELLIVPGDHGSYIGELLSLGSKSKMPEYVRGIITEFLKQ